MSRKVSGWLTKKRQKMQSRHEPDCSVDPPTYPMHRGAGSIWVSGAGFLAGSLNAGSAIAKCGKQEPGQRGDDDQRDRKTKKEIDVTGFFGVDCAGKLGKPASEGFGRFGNAVQMGAPPIVQAPRRHDQPGSQEACTTELGFHFTTTFPYALISRSGIGADRWQLSMARSRWKSVWRCITMQPSLMPRRPLGCKRNWPRRTRSQRSHHRCGRHRHRARSQSCRPFKRSSSGPRRPPVWRSRM